MSTPSNSEHQSNLPTSKSHLKLTEDQKKYMIEQFFAKKTKFPVFSTYFIDEAINLDLLPYEMRDKILRDPNKISLFFIELNPDSPRTREALDQLGYVEDGYVIETFQQFYSSYRDTHPIQVLIHYMQYLQHKYKERLKIISTRNQIKKMEKYNKNQKNKKQETKTNISQNQLFLTDTNPTQQQVTLMSKSFNSRSIDFLQCSYDEKMEFHQKKNEDYLKTLQKRRQLEEQQINSLHDYYQSIIPIRQQKVKAVQEANLMKQKERKKRFKERHEKTMNKIKILEERSQESRQKIHEQLQQKIFQQEANLQSIQSKHNKDLQEIQEKINIKEQMRLEKRQQAIQLEEEKIEEIIGKNYEKEIIASQVLKRLKEELNLKKYQNQLKHQQAMLKVDLKQQEIENSKLQSFIQISNQGNKIVEEQKEIRVNQLTQLKSKSQQVLHKVLDNKKKLQQTEQQRIDEIKKREEDKNVTNRLFSIQQSVDSRIREQSEKNRIRMQRALRNTKQFAEEQEIHQQKLINKIIEENQKQKIMKQRQEQYKEGMLKEHLRMRQSVDRIVHGN